MVQESTHILVYSSSPVFTCIHGFQFRMTKIGIQNRRNSCQITKGLILLPLLNVPLVVWKIVIGLCIICACTRIHVRRRQALLMMRLKLWPTRPCRLIRKFKPRKRWSALECLKPAFQVKTWWHLNKYFILTNTDNILCVNQVKCNLAST